MPTCATPATGEEESSAARVYGGVNSLRRSVVTFFALTALAYACGDSSSGPTVDDAGAPTTSAKKDGGSADATPNETDSGAIADAGRSKDSSAARDAGSAADANTDGGDAGWPDCLTQPTNVSTKTIDAIWTDNANAPAEVWLSGVYVSAVSRGGCSANQACHLYVQEATTYASLAAGAHKAIKVLLSSSVASRFASVAVGDRVDLLGWGWHYNLFGQNELLVQVAQALPGCMNKVGSGTLVPITGVALADLTHASYDLYGPLLVKLNALSGKPTGTAAETFGLFATGFDGSFPDAGTDIVSLSPFYLQGQQFANPPVVLGSVNAFASVTGVFGLFAPFVDAGTSARYLELYPRTPADIVK